MPQFIIRCAQRHCSSVFARPSLVLFLLAICAAEISAATPDFLGRSLPLHRGFTTTNTSAENAAAEITFRKVF